MRSLTSPGSHRWELRQPGFTGYSCTVVVGVGGVDWQRMADDLRHWRVKTRSGFAVHPDAPASTGQRAVITVRMLGLLIREPVEVVEVVESDTCVGFAYRTLPGHPVHGEEAFILHRDIRGVVRFTLRSLTAPAPRGAFRALFPLLRIAQSVVRRRYLRALH